MAINPKLKGELKLELINKLKYKLNKHNFTKKSGNPFIDIVFGKYSNVKTFIHSTATMLGSEYEIMARKIARTNPNFVEAKKMVIEGSISDAEKSKIKDIVKDLEEKSRKANYEKEINEILLADENNLKKTRITIDLYLKTKDNREVFIEMKGPDPNKKEVRAAKEDLVKLLPRLSQSQQAMGLYASGIKSIILN